MWPPELITAAAGVVFGAGGAWVVLQRHGRNLNGLGRKVAAAIACQLRCAAEEEPISKAKLLHIADLLDPR